MAHLDTECHWFIPQIRLLNWVSFLKVDEHDEMTGKYPLVNDGF